MSLKENFKSGYMYNQNKANSHVISPKLDDELDNIRSDVSRRKKYGKNDGKIYSNRYQSEAQKVYNDNSSGLISPIHNQNSQTDRSVRNIFLLPEKSNKNKIESKQTNPSESTQGSQIYTFRERNKNEEYFRKSKIEIKIVKALGKENKPYNTTSDENLTLNVNEQRYKTENKLGNYEDKNIMRRSNPVGSFQQETDQKDSFKEPNSKTTQNESTISESSNTHLSKSEVNFYKSGSKKRLRSRRKNSKPKFDCKSTREGEDKSQNLGIYGSILENTRNKRKSVSRPIDKDSVGYYKDKYNRMKRMYEYEKTNQTNELHQLAQENAQLKKNIIISKQDHKDDINKLKQELEEAFSKMEYYEDIIRGRSRIDSITEEISRSCTESKMGESTVESDKLANLLKNKEDNIKRLMQELKHSNDKTDESKDL
jgi:hypothetical protein